MIKSVLPRVVVLHNIRSVHNVGSIFRTADGAGVEKIFMCGITPTPLDRFGKYRKDFSKVALGAEKKMPWEHVARTTVLLRRLQREGWHVVAVEQSPRARDIWKVSSKLRNKKRIAVIFGAEVEGLSTSILHIADAIVEIPMYGEKESLNVSVAAGIALFGLRA
ncbi:MAG: TrmH family RNA methyltransferase [Patescibacteria group bacterium]|nr:TrmH family RNA methyltransferase [Patescibacteria group bacterium]